MKLPSYAGVAVTLALSLSLTSAAYAADRLGKNVVRSKNIAPKAVKASDIKSGAVNGSHVDESSLGTVPSATLAQAALTAVNVNGVREQPVRAALATTSPLTTVTIIDGLDIRFGCNVNFVVLEVAATSPQDYGLFSITAGGTTTHDTFGLNSQLPSTGAGVGGTSVGVVTLLRANGRTVRFDFHLRYVVDGMGSSNDCFLAGFARSLA